MRTQNSWQKNRLPLLKSNRDNWIWIALAVLFLTTFLIYFKALKFDFLSWDDDKYITQNPAIKDFKWENIKLFFTDFYNWNYQPLTMLTYAAEYKVMGNSASIFHLNNILLHLANSFLVFVLIRKISPKNLITALITAAFFAVHPMHVESVAWISERKDVLYAFFFLLSLIQYANYLNSGKLKSLIYSGIFFLLSCLSKSAAVILPLVMVLLDYYLNRKFDWKMALEKIPFLIISVIVGIVALYSQKSAIRPEFTISVLHHFFIVVDAFATYITRVFIPIHLCAIYPYPNLAGSSLPLSYYLSGIFVGFILYFVWYSRRWGKDAVFGFGFFIVTIILVLQIIAVGNATMADRYTYIPYIGIFFIIGKVYEYLSAFADIYKKSFLFFIVICFLMFTKVSASRLNFWENDDSFYGNILDQYPDCTIALNNRGCCYYNSYLTSVDHKTQMIYLNKAISDFTRVIKINNNYSDIYPKIANAEFMAKDYASAIKDFTISIQKDPQNSDWYFTRGLAHCYVNNHLNAIKDFTKSIELNPQKVSAYFNRGLTNFMAKDYSAAINDFSKTLQVDPTNKEVYLNRGLAYYMSEDYFTAMNDFNKTIELNPQDSQGYFNRANTKVYLKDYKDAIADYDKTIELNPKDEAAIKNREIVKTLLEKAIK